MTQEFQRFLTLFEQMALFCEAWLDRMPPDKLDWVPIENASMKFGDRVSRITVQGLVVHVAVGEHHWINSIPAVADGAVISIPRNKALEEELMAGDWRENVRRLHRENMARLRAYTQADLERKVVFADHTYTGMGLLWSMHAHRAFHLGNIDIYLRQTDTVAPDFFRWPAETMA